MKKTIVFLCGARDFHAMDWYRSALELIPKNEIKIVTDLIEGEGFKKLVNSEDPIYKLLILDKFLFKKQSSLGDKWRNLLKLIVLPLQIILLKKFARNNPNCVYHAHSIYYLVLARAAGVEYVGTPQGSDILVKPFRSRFYRSFAIYGLRRAKSITVDSVNMQLGVKTLVDRDAIIIQNGINVKIIHNFLKSSAMLSTHRRNGLLSIRGFTSLYRIKEIIKSRNLFLNEKITFIYPFHELVYKSECAELIREGDTDFGRVEKDKLYQLMCSTKLVISIPQSDSSPRSVYEAVFCGAPVAITYNAYYENLPDCMKQRIIIVDLNNEKWLIEALNKADDIAKSDFIPSKKALTMFDQLESSKVMLNLLRS